MRISFKGDYALKVILDLSLNFGKGLSQIKDISKRQDIPEKYLEQIIIILKGANFIRTQRGAKGGIYLAKDPSKITIGEVIRLTEGHTSPITCVSTSAYTKCNFESGCVFKEIWVDVKNKINEVVDNISFADLVKKHNKLQGKDTLDYVI